MNVVRGRFGPLLLLCLSASAAAQTPAQITWAKDARSYRMGQSITVTCPPFGSPDTVWGTDVYTNDSSICTAAVHARLASIEEGGTVVVNIRPGQSSYRGTTRNGVKSQNFDDWEGSFSLAPYVPPPDPEPEAAPAAATAPALPVISWQRDAVGLAPNGRQFTFVCPGRTTAAQVMGVDVYSWNSSICSAAVHAGLLTAKGGGVTIEMRPGLERYTGSARNGITSMAGPRTILGFIIIKPVGQE